MRCARPITALRERPNIAASFEEGVVSHKIAEIESDLEKLTRGK